MTADRPALLDRSGFRLGGRHIVRREHAPHGRVLPYRRAAGETPARMTTGGEAVRRYGWSVATGEHGLGAMVLGLGLVQAMAEATTPAELRYSGPCPELMRRCSLSISARRASGPHVIHTATREPVRFEATPEQSPVWLDVLDQEHVEVHATLPMRSYLAAEEFLGIALPTTQAPAPTFVSSQTVRPFRVVFVETARRPRSGYGIDGFAGIARALAECLTAPWTFSVIPKLGTVEAWLPPGGIGFDVLDRADIAGCVDMFASAELVIGDNCGLTHLAALAERPDRTGPHVVGLRPQCPHTASTTGRDRHRAANVTTLPIEVIASLAGHLTGWW